MQVAQVEEVGFVGGIVDVAVEYLDETGMNPIDKTDEAVDRLDSTAIAYERANRN